MNTKDIGKLVANISGYTGLILVVISLLGFVITGVTASWLWAFDSDTSNIFGRLCLAFIASFIAGIILVLTAAGVESFTK